MNKALKVALHEYKRHVLRRRFWIALLAFPLGIVLIMGLSTILSVSAIDKNPIGFVDQGNVLTVAPKNDERKGLFVFDVPLVSYPDESAARQAVAEGKAQGYFLLDEAFRTDHQLTYYSDKPLPVDARKKIDGFIRQNLLATVQAENIARLDEGSKMEMISMDGSRTIDDSEVASFVVPLVVAVIFVFIILMSGSYLLQAVVEEKENRTMEVMITSVSPNQLMTGKILGNMGVGLTQMLFWIVLIGAAMMIFKDRFAFLQNLDLSWGMLAKSVLIMLPSFVFVSALMATLGATVTDSQESQQFSGIIIMPIIIPFYFMALFMFNPNGVIAKGLSYFPLTSPVATALRMAFTNLSAGEMALIFGLQTLFAVFSVWLAGKAFKAGMLQYSKRMNLRDLFRKEAQHG